MKITTSITKIQLDEDERELLIEASKILRKVNSAINDDKMSYVVDNVDMSLYNNIYGAVERIEDYIMIEE